MVLFVGYEFGFLVVVGILIIILGVIVIYFVCNYIVKGFVLGRV